MIRIIIDLNDQDARILRSWASIGRFIDAVLRGCDRNVSPENDALYEDAQYLKPALDALHREVRQKLIQAEVKPLWRQVEWERKD